MMTVWCICVLAIAGVCTTQAQVLFCPRYGISVYLNSGDSPAALQGVINKFESALGGIDNEDVPGPAESGRRSIDWDSAAIPFDMPGEYFSRTIPRGITFLSKDGQFAVSNPATPQPQDDRFSSIVPTAISSMFQRYSSPRLFTPVRNNLVIAEFSIPGSNMRASTIGFGAIFSGVDEFRETFMTFYDRNGCILAKMFVPPSDGGLTFAGIIVRHPWDWATKLLVIHRVEIKLGTVAMEVVKNSPPETPTGDLVALDDMIWGEPSQP